VVLLVANDGLHVVRRLTYEVDSRNWKNYPSNGPRLPNEGKIFTHPLKIGPSVCCDPKRFDFESYPQFYYFNADGARTRR
jgi:hypothetical protein